VLLNLADSFAFEGFLLDTRDRRLTSGGMPVEVNGRYFDALVLLVRDHGRLISKDRFLGEVWRGVPVTDEALTQCVRTLRRQLGDDAARPRFIETVPKHGYRFIAPVEVVGGKPAQVAGNDARWRQLAVIGGAGTLGGLIAGLIGGLVYGLAATSQPGVGASSTAVVLLSITLLVGALGAAGVSFAIAAAGLARAESWPWMTIAGASGGLIVGAFGKLLGVDAAQLLVGQSPGNITGAPEGAILGAAVGLGAWLATRAKSLQSGVAAAAACGTAASGLIALVGGRLMLGSLLRLTEHFAGSRLRLDAMGAIVGESGVGPITLASATVLEGTLFTACVVAAMQLARSGSSACAAT
jgi:DNA-binding winged helix-turn-helix (wHTH) protein